MKRRTAMRSPVDAVSRRVVRRAHRRTSAAHRRRPSPRASLPPCGALRSQGCPLNARRTHPEECTIADIACDGWTLAATTFLGDVLADSLSTKPAVRAWLERVGSRPAVARSMGVPQV
jgi:hypothetical protein